jgi:uncharacterized membrane protein YfcA
MGRVTYRTLRRQNEPVAVSNIASVIGAVGGAAVTALFTKEFFAWYSIGLAFGFFLYLILGHTVFKCPQRAKNARHTDLHQPGG